MPEPIEVEARSSTDDAIELATLRNVHAEVLTKRQRDKAKIAALEIEAIALQEKAKKAETAAHDALIGIPLRNMAAKVSEVPELFLAEFAKHYTIAADKDGKIVVNSLDGQPAIDRNGKPVEFTPHSLYSHLASQAVVAGGTKDERSKVFAVLMRYHGASGASGASSNQRTNRASKPESEPKPQFGLR